MGCGRPCPQPRSWSPSCQDARDGEPSQRRSPIPPPAGGGDPEPGRGALIDDEALLSALDRGHIGHATLDVFRVEPLPQDHPFWSHPRVTVTPHIAADTRAVTASPRDRREHPAGRSGGAVPPPRRPRAGLLTRRSSLPSVALRCAPRERPKGREEPSRGATGREWNSRARFAVPACGQTRAGHEIRNGRGPCVWRREASGR